MRFVKLNYFLLLFLCWLPDVSYSATEYATFESFYKESASVGWAIALVASLIAGAAIFFTGGTASPIVVSIGTWIGGTMGLSGAAATNAGLALLGGGSIASGGFGIVGGTAVLTTALTFGTEAVLDYTLETAINEYKYSALVTKSENMQTLPLPMNETGPNAYENASKILNDYNIDKPNFYYGNQQIIKDAIKELETDQEELDPDERSMNKTLLSLLYFVSNNYTVAKSHADKAVQLARYSGIRRTLPAFIYATSALYEEEFDFDYITKNYFRYSILAEPDNPLIPLLFSIYIDRMQLRFNDDYLDERDYIQIFNIMKTPSIKSMRETNYAIILTRYIVRLKHEQQTIQALVETSSKSLKQSPNILIALEDSLMAYERLLKDSNYIIRSLFSLDLDSDGWNKVSEFSKLWVQYAQDLPRLESLINDFKAEQAEPTYISSRYLYIAIVALVIVGLFVLIRTKYRNN